MRRPLIVIVSLCLISGVMLTANAQQPPMSTALQPLGDIKQLRQQIQSLRQQEEPLKKQVRDIESQIRPLRQQIIKLGGGHHQGQQHNVPALPK